MAEVIGDAGRATSMRSLLYVPADQPAMLSKAVRSGADAVIADLEDAVPERRKEQARAELAAWLRADPHPAVPVWVRVDPMHLPDCDLAELLTPAVTGIVLPKAEPANLAAADDVLRRCQSSWSLAPNGLPIIPLVESALGLVSVHAIAAMPRVLRLGMGEVDLAADLRITLTPERAELLPIRLQVVVASAAAGIQAPVASTSTAFRDLDAMRTSTRQLRALGFRARTAIHPAQAAVINEVFTPSAAEVEQAREILGRFSAASGGPTVDADGHFVDEAVVRSARELLALVHHPS